MKKLWGKRWFRYLVLAIIAINFLTLFGFYDGTSEPQTASQTSVSTNQVSDTKPTVKELHKLVNAERKKVGLKPLELYQPLNNSAADKCMDMVDRRYFDHSDPDDKPFYEPIRKYTYYQNAGENLATNYETANETVLAWMKSKSHKANILNSHYNYVGYYICNTKTDVYLVQHFIQL